MCSVCFRVAVMTVAYHNCLLDGSLSGRAALSHRLLRALGFKVLLVHFKEMMASKKPLDRARLMEKKLKELISN